MEPVRIMGLSPTGIVIRGKDFSGGLDIVARTAKQKRILDRLKQIKDRASEMNAEQDTTNFTTGSDLAEEAAELGLQLLDEGDDD